MDVSNLPSGYYKATVESGFMVYDGHGVNFPNEVKGRLLLVGVFDMTKEPKFGEVAYASTEPYQLEFSDSQNCSSKDFATFTIDGVVAEVNDRVLLKDQANPAENGLYYVSKVGSESEKFELKRTSDANAIGAMTQGKFAFVAKGNKNGNHVIQLMPYDTTKPFGEAEFNFIDLTSEGFYANSINGFRLQHSLACSDLQARDSSYSFASPDFLNVESKRLLKILVGYDVSIQTVMSYLLEKQFSFNESIPCNCTSYL